MDRFIGVVERTAGIFIGLVAIITFVEATVRYLISPYYPEFGHIPDVFIIGQTFQGIAICWGIATATYADRHVTVDVLYSAVGKTMRYVFDTVAYTLMMVFMMLFGWYTTEKVFDILDAGEVSHELFIPLGFGYAIAAVGVVIAALLSALRWWQVVVLRRPAHAAGDEEAI